MRGDEGGAKRERGGRTRAGLTALDLRARISSATALEGARTEKGKTHNEVRDAHEERVLLSELERLVEDLCKKRHVRRVSRAATASGSGEKSRRTVDRVVHVVTQRLVPEVVPLPGELRAAGRTESVARSSRERAGPTAQERRTHLVDERRDVVERALERPLAELDLRKEPSQRAHGPWPSRGRGEGRQRTALVVKPTRRTKSSVVRSTSGMRKPSGGRCGSGAAAGEAR